MAAFENSVWKNPLLTSVFFLLTSVFLTPHGTMLMAFADVDANVSRVGSPNPLKIISISISLSFYFI